MHTNNTAKLSDPQGDHSVTNYTIFISTTTSNLTLPTYIHIYQPTHSYTHLSVWQKTLLEATTVPQYHS